MTSQRPLLTIIYATVTGNSRDAAEMLAREAERRRYGARVVDAVEYDVRQLPTERIVLFAVPTTGQGDVPPSFR